eukprot:TRINITY_DN55934_c0_g1_i1.p1 TRINITY_DN55934_c0_g1~~TRINITY_DN55934_c0_g1_i1.p1  ORF type:complete len:384 (-),score=57.40 TRINITY_DN55934_c0_g1_i1:46-1164(-)
MDASTGTTGAAVTVSVGTGTTDPVAVLPPAEPVEPFLNPSCLPPELLTILQRLTWKAFLEEERTRMLAAGLMPQLVACMEAHLWEESLQVSAAELICAVSTSPACAAVLVAEHPRVVESLLAAMKHAPKDTATQHTGCKALRLMAAAPGAVEPCLKLGSAGAVLAAMQACEAAAVHLEASWFFFNVLNACPALAEEMALEGVVPEFLAETLRLHYSHSECTERACEALVGFTKFPNLVPRLVELEVVDSMLLAIETHIYNPSTIERSAALMRGLLRECQDDHVDCATTLLKVFRKHHGKPDVRQAGMFASCAAALADLCVYEKPKTYLMEHQAHTVAGDLLRTMASNPCPEFAPCAEELQRFLRSLVVPKWA